jgi:hypothetical protein
MLPQYIINRIARNIHDFKKVKPVRLRLHQ